MDAPLRPYWQGSRKGPTIGKSQSDKKDSKILLLKAVLAMFLSWSSEDGGYDFGIGVWYSTTHWRGYWSVLRMELNMAVIGVDSSQLNSCTNFLGRSPGTIEFGFLALHILV